MRRTIDRASGICEWCSPVEFLCGIIGRRGRRWELSQLPRKCCTWCLCRKKGIFIKINLLGLFTIWLPRTFGSFTWGYTLFSTASFNWEHVNNKFIKPRITSYQQWVVFLRHKHFFFICQKRRPCKKYWGTAQNIPAAIFRLRFTLKIINISQKHVLLSC